MPQMIAERSWRFPNRMPALTKVVREVSAWMDELPFANRAKYSATLTVEEMGSNIVKYAYDDSDEHEIHLHMVANQDVVEITFEDDGHPFDPTQQPPPDMEKIVAAPKSGGLGIELVRRISEKMHYFRQNNRNRLTVAIRRLEAHDTQLLAFT